MERSNWQNPQTLAVLWYCTQRKRRWWKRTDPKALGCDSRGWEVGGVGAVQRLPTAPPLATAGAAGQGGPDSRAQWPGPAADPSLGLGPTQNQQISRSSREWAKVTHPKEDYVTPRIHSDPQGPSFWFLDGGQIQQLTLSFRGEILMYPTPPDI